MFKGDIDNYDNDLKLENGGGFLHVVILTCIPIVEMTDLVSGSNSMTAPSSPLLATAIHK